MTPSASIRYLGFESTDDAREYSLVIRQGEISSRVTVRILHAAFADRRTRYQDGPDISFLKVQHELALHDNQPPDEALLVTDSELAAYRSAHEKQPGRRARPAVPSESAPR